MRKLIAILAIIIAAPFASAASLEETAFERLKSLEGAWIGKSTRGWTDRKTYRVIAGGSVVMSTAFDSHPGETMASMFHLDRGRLMITHYCVAKNQPRLVASDISPDAKTITFTFHDGTGMASRDQGHMDKLVMTFPDSDHFTSHWTWYQKGKEEWMEKIEHERVRD